MSDLISTSTTVKGLQTITEQNVYADDLYQPYDDLQLPQYFLFHFTLQPEKVVPQDSPELPDYFQVNGYFTSQYVVSLIEYTWIGIYSIVSAGYGGSGAEPFPQYHGNLIRYKGSTQPPDYPQLTVYSGDNNAVYRWAWAPGFVTRKRYSEKVSVQASSSKPNKPNYSSFVTGYALDTRKIPSNPKIVSPITGLINIEYYQNNPNESIPNLKSIEWRKYQVKVKAGELITLPITNLVLGTLQVSSSIKSLINALPTLSGDYAWAYAFTESIGQLFGVWMGMYVAIPVTDNQPDTSILSSITSTSHQQIVETSRIVRRISANNNWANNQPLNYLNSDLNPLATHPMFMLDEARTFDYHFAAQQDGSRGILTMDSPRVVETREKVGQISVALDADKFSANELNPDELRIPTLGWHINRQSEIWGIRVDANGKINETTEKSDQIRTHADGNESNNPQEYNPNCFGSKGMLIRHLPNKFTPDGVAAGGYRRIHDIPQLLSELHEQANIAIGYQEGTAIEVSIDGQTYRYPNQLALITELLITSKQVVTYSKGAFFSSLVSEQSIKEVIGGLGLRTVDKFLEFSIAGKAVKLYYKGISASQSLRRKLSEISTNVAMTLGNII